MNTELYSAIAALGFVLLSLTDSASNTAMLNAALARGGLVRVGTPGTYPFAKSATITRSSGLTYDLCLVIPSNTTLACAPGVGLKTLAGLNNPALIQNADPVNGNSGIRLEGGLYDGNSANVTRTDVANDFACVHMAFQNVTDLSLQSVKVKNPRAWGIGISACKTVRCTDTIFKYDCPVTANQGGYQFQGANHDVIVRNTAGNPYDDMVAFVTEFPPQNGMAGPGPVSDILIDGVIADATAGCMHLVRLQGTAGNPLTGATVRNLSGPYTDGAYIQVLVTGVVTIDGVDCNPLPGSAPSQATILVRQNFECVSISNVNRAYNDAGETTKRNTIEIGGGGTGAQLKVDKVHVQDTTAAGANAAVINVGNFTVASLETSNLDASSAVASNQLVNISSTAQIGRWTGSNFTLSRIKQILNNLGTIGNGVFLANVYSFANAAPAFVHNKVGAFPLLALTNVNLDSTQGGAAGCINVTGVTGTMEIQAENCTFNNGANPNLVRAGAESIRVQAPQLPFPSGILTPQRGDMILDSSNSNDPYRYNGSQWVAL